jgi:AcrR family transcriptional regulator
VTVLALGPEALTSDDGAWPVDGLTERIIDGALRCVARWGVSKTTLDDIAREAGCGRATVYRLFPGGRDGLWDAVVLTEARRFMGRLVARAEEQTGLEDVLVAVVAQAAGDLAHHPALNFLLAHEPETILPQLTFHHMDRVLAAVSAAVGPLLTPWLEAGATDETAARAAEWIARIVLSYLLSPSPDVDLADEASARRIIQQFVLPGLRPAVHQSA